MKKALVIIINLFIILILIFPFIMKPSPKNLGISLFIIVAWLGIRWFLKEQKEKEKRKKK